MYLSSAFFQSPESRMRLPSSISFEAEGFFLTLRIGFLTEKRVGQARKCLGKSRNKRGADFSLPRRQFCRGVAPGRRRGVEKSLDPQARVPAPRLVFAVTPCTPHVPKRNFDATHQAYLVPERRGFQRLA